MVGSITYILFTACLSAQQVNLFDEGPSPKLAQSEGGSRGNIES